MACTLINVQFLVLLLDHSRLFSVDIMIFRAGDLEPPSHLVILASACLWDLLIDFQIMQLNQDLRFI